MVVTDWLAKLIGLPDVFLNSNEVPGAGIIQCTASDATFVALLSARSRAIEHMDGKKLSEQVGAQQQQMSIDGGDKDKSITNRLIVYCSDQASTFNITPWH
jgi:glutamate/tyrosine decarboxylase-like PLP-dependent enzyme